MMLIEQFCRQATVLVFECQVVFLQVILLDDLRDDDLVK
jgi:hypothetical protein